MMVVFLILGISYWGGKGLFWTYSPDCKIINPLRPMLSINAHADLYEASCEYVRGGDTVENCALRETFINVGVTFTPLKYFEAILLMSYIGERVSDREGNKLDESGGRGNSFIGGKCYFLPSRVLKAGFLTGISLPIGDKPWSDSIFKGFVCGILNFDASEISLKTPFRMNINVGYENPSDNPMVIRLGLAISSRYVDYIVEGQVWGKSFGDILKKPVEEQLGELIYGFRFKPLEILSFDIAQVITTWDRMSWYRFKQPMHITAIPTGKLTWRVVAGFSISAPVLRTRELVPRGAIAGRVFHKKTGTPLMNAKVKIKELKRVKRTDQYGVFKFKDVPPGVYTVIAEAAGYRRSQKVVTVERKKTVICDMEMIKPGEEEEKAPPPVVEVKAPEKPEIQPVVKVEPKIEIPEIKMEAPEWLKELLEKKEEPEEKPTEIKVVQQMANRGRITGVVKGVDGRRVRASIRYEGPMTGTVDTDKDGNFVIENLMPGFYDIYVYPHEKPYLPGSVKEITVDVGEERKVEVTLEMGYLLRILFPSGEAIIPPTFYKDLHRVAKFIKEHPDCIFEIRGHTDSRPIRTKRYPNNLILSEARAKAVYDFLIYRCGVSPSQLRYVGFGSARPIASNATPEGRAANRRVEIVMIPKR